MDGRASSQIKAVESDPYHIKKNEFTIGTKLIKGGFGTAYCGMWNNQTVCIKKINIKNQSPSKCMHEINTLRKLTELNARHVVALYGYTIVTQHSSQKYYIITEYMPKGDLRNYIYGNKCPEWTVRNKIMHSITQGVIFLHDLNIIHCDVKPENILMGDNNEIKLCDFSDAKNSGDQIVDSIGTCGYFAPEIILNNQVTKKSDIYSLGIIFWEIAAWNDAYVAISNEVISTMTVNGLREPIPHFWPKGTAELIASCWAQDPIDRPEAQNIPPRIGM